MDDDLVQLSYWVSKMKQEIDCPICLHTFNVPVTTKCSHTFCSECISQVMRSTKYSCCPLCKGRISRRDLMVNSKIESFIEQIKRIVELIIGESPVNILTYHIGKSFNPNTDHEKSQDTDEVEQPSCQLSRNLNDRAPAKDGQIIAHDNESYSELDHLSVSQNVCQEPKSVKSSVLSKSSISTPTTERIKTPVKKVEEWLTKNNVESSHVSVPPSLSDSVTEVGETVESANGFKGFTPDVPKIKTAVKLSEIRSIDSSHRVKKVYKGLRYSEESPSKHGRKKSPITIEKEQDFILDSCPVEVNDTFDKLFTDVKISGTTALPSPDKSKEIEEPQSIGLFESLPLPPENTERRKTRSSGARRSESYRNSKRRKLSQGKKDGSNVEENIYVSKTSLGDENAVIDIDKTNNTDKTVLPKPAFEESVDGEYGQEYDGTSNKKNLEKTNIKGKTTDSVDLNKTTPKSGKKRLDVSLNSPGWSRLYSSRKDFKDSRKAALPMLNVSGGDACNTSANRSHSNKSRIISGIKPISTPLHIDDTESKVTQMEKSKDMTLPTRKSGAKLSSSECSNLMSKEDINGNGKVVHREDESPLKSISNTEIIPSLKTSNKSRLSEEKQVAETCENENIIDSHSSVEKENKSHNRVPKNKKNNFKANVADFNSAERKTFSLNTSTQDLSELDDSILRESTEDQLRTLTKNTAPVHFYKSPRSKFSLSLAKGVAEQESILLKKDLQSSSIEHSKYKDIKFNKLEDDANLLQSKHPSGGVKNVSGKSVPILKMGRLTKSKPHFKFQVKYHLLGKLKHHGGMERCPKTTPEAINHLEIRSQEEKTTRNKTIDVETQTELSLLSSYSLSESCQVPDDLIEKVQGSKDYPINKSYIEKDDRIISSSDEGDEYFLETERSGPKNKRILGKQYAVTTKTRGLLPRSLYPSLSGRHIRNAEDVSQESDLFSDEDGVKSKMDVGDKHSLENKLAVVENSAEDSDDIVEASQKSSVSSQSIMSIKKGALSLVASGLTSQEIAHVKCLAQRFNLYFSPQFCGLEKPSDAPCTTHVVAKADSNGKTSCTFKYLCGVMTGCWILSIKWVIDSLSADQLLDEKPYEIVDANGDSGRLAVKNLFEGLEFICKEPYTDLTGDQMKELLQLGGGKIVRNPEHIPTSRGKCIAIAEASMNNTNFIQLMNHHNIVVVTYEWVVECVEEKRILSLINYVLAMESDFVSPITVQERLLEMGYSDDLTKIDDVSLGSTEDMSIISD